MVEHNIDPVYDQNSRILILGSFPSVKSREHRFFYHHPQNRFWRVLESLYGSHRLETVGDKKAFLLRHQIALWDVIQCCDIAGSSDSSIEHVVVNDIKPILSLADIQAVYCNGTTAYKLYNQYMLPDTGIQAVRLPSTSPANAAWTLDRLCSVWEQIK